MVTKLADGRGQTTLKAHAVTDEWEALAKGAAKRNGQSVADFVVTTTTAAAQAILKGESAVPAALPARQEDVADQLDQLLARFAERIEETEKRAQEREEELLRQHEERTEAIAAELRQNTTQQFDQFHEKMTQQLRRGLWRR